MKRSLDKLGRIFIPSEIRKEFGWNEQSNLRITTTHNGVNITEDKNVCATCGGSTNVVSVTALDGVKMCMECLNKLKSMY